MRHALDPDAFASLARTLRDIGDEVYTEVLEIYLVDAPPRAAALRALDPDTQRRAAHALRGSASSVGATRLAELCLALEEAPEGRDTEPLVARIEAEMDRVVAALRRALAEAA